MHDIIDKVRNDPFARFLGVEVETAASGHARCSLTVEPHMLNFGGTIHGGLLFSLADVVFSLVSNAEHFPSVALNVTANYFKTAKVGDRLTAQAHQIASSRRFSTFLIEVSCNERLLASFTCTAYKIPTES